MSVSISETDLIGKSSSALDAALGNKTLILSLNTSVSVELNRVGSEVWKLLETQKSFGELTDALTVKFVVEKKVAKQEVTKLLLDLKGHGLITIEVCE